MKSWLVYGQGLPHRKFLVVIQDRHGCISPNYVKAEGYGYFAERCVNNDVVIVAVYDLHEEHATFEEQLAADNPWFTGSSNQNIKPKENKMLDIQQLVKGYISQLRDNSGNLDKVAVRGMLAKIGINVSMSELTELLKSVSDNNAIANDEHVDEQQSVTVIPKVYNIYILGQPPMLLTDLALAERYVSALNNQDGSGTPSVSTHSAVMIDGDVYRISNPISTASSMDNMVKSAHEFIENDRRSLAQRRQDILAKLTDDEKAILGL